MRITRRAFVGGLAMAVAGGRLSAQQKLQTNFLSSAVLAVSDLDRSIAFYERLFGAARREGGRAVFDFHQAGRSLVLRATRSGEKPAIVSYAMAVKANTIEALTAALQASGIARVPDSPTSEVWIADTDSTPIQLVTGTPATRPSGRGGQFDIQSISHLTLRPRDGAKARAFYEGSLGLKLQAMQGKSTACLALGNGPDFIAFGVIPNPNAAASANMAIGPDHVCLTLRGFDANKVTGILMKAGLEPIEYSPQAPPRPLTCRTRLRQRASNGGGPTHPLGTPELYFNDPDNLAIQLQDVSYCGGSGLNGEICP